MLKIKKKKDRGLTGRHETHPSLSQGKKSKNSGGGVSWRFSAEKLCLIHQMKWSGERKEEGKQALSWKSQRLRASWKISCRTLHRSRLFWSWPLSSEVRPKKKKKTEFYAKAQCWSSRAWSQGCAATGLLGRIHMENNELVSGSSQRQLSQSELVNKQMGAGGGIAPLPL